MKNIFINTVFLIFTLLSFEVIAVEPKIIYEEDPTSLISNIQVVLLAGSIDDPLNKIGLNNFYTELMLRGTKKRSREKFQSELERMGASLGVATGHDKTIFEGKVIKENTSAFIKLLEECLLQPKFDEKEFESLKKELLAEVSYIKNVNNRLGGLAMRKELYHGTPFESPGNGTLSTLGNIKLEDVKKAYNNQFHRANLVFAIASPFKEAEMAEPIKKMWLAFPDGARKSARTITPNLPKEPTLVVIHKPNTSTGSLMFAQGGITAQDPARFALLAGNFSFGGEPLVSRLFKTIRGELGWTYAIGSTYYAMGSLSYQPGLFAISSTPSVEFTSKTILKTISMWNEYLDTGLTKNELKLSLESSINSYPFEFDSAGKRLGRKLYSYLYNVPNYTPSEYEKIMKDIDNSKIRDAINKKHNGKGWFIALVADKDKVAAQLQEEQKGIPPEKQIKISKVYTPEELIK